MCAAFLGGAHPASLGRHPSAAYIRAMSFDVGAEAYARFMGRFSEPLGAELTALIGPTRGQRALDVGCGPGALTAQLVSRLGADAVSAIDPSGSFVAAALARFPALDVRQGSAERLPYPDREFDLTLAQLVVHFMTDPAAGLSEMARVTKPGGVVAACVWDYGGERSPLSAFWRAAHDLDPDVRDEAGLPGARAGDLVTLVEQAGLGEVAGATLTVQVPCPSFDDWWDPFTLGVGPAGAYVAGLDEARREQLRQRCRELLPAGPFDIEASAWAATGRAS
jgi:SAM-dependent methyltransferase